MAYSVNSNEQEKGKESKDRNFQSQYSIKREELSSISKKDSHRFSHQLMKVLAGISVLLSILAIVAMIADLYFNNTFVYITNSLFKGRYLSKDNSENIVDQVISDKSSLSYNKRYLTKRPVFEIFDDLPDPKTEEEPLSEKELINNKISIVEPPKENIKKNIDTKIEEKVIPPTEIEQDDKQIDSQSEIEKRVAQKRGKIPRVAIIIDDIGFDPKIADAISRIEKNLTISILPGSPYSRQIAKKLHSKGMEIILHQPMEPLQYPSVDPGYGAILVNMAHEDIATVLRKNLAELPQAKGVNNHMGSKLTTLSEPMQHIFTMLKQRDLFFIDSITSNQSAGRDSAKLIKLPFASRDIFLDNIKDKRYIKNQLNQLIKIAKQTGEAIGIGHPYNETFLVLKEEIPALKKSVKIVPVSQLVSQS